jgi:hypothetical protein
MRGEIRATDSHLLKLSEGMRDPEAHKLVEQSVEQPSRAVASPEYWSVVTLKLLP